MDIIAYGEISEELAQANTERIISCVNGCRGLSNKVLDGGVVQEMVEALKKSQKYIKSICEEAKRKSVYNDGNYDLLDEIERAIEKVEK